MTKGEVSWSLRESWFASSNHSAIFKEKIYLEGLFQEKFQVTQRTELEKSNCEFLLQKL